MTRRHIETFARYFRTPPAARQRPRGAVVRPAAGKPRTGEPPIHVQDRAGRPPAKKRARHKRICGG